MPKSKTLKLINPTELPSSVWLLLLLFYQAPKCLCVCVLWWRALQKRGSVLSQLFLFVKTEYSNWNRHFKIHHLWIMLISAVESFTATVTSQSEHAIDQKFICMSLFLTSIIFYIYMDRVKQSEGCSTPSPLIFEKTWICNYFPSILPHHYLRDLPLSLSFCFFVLLVHQELRFDIHVAAWLRCRRDSCKVLGHLLLLLCFLFTSCTFSSSSFPLLPLPWFILSLLLWGCITELVPASQHVFLYDSHNNHHFLTTKLAMTWHQVSLNLVQGEKRKTVLFFYFHTLKCYILLHIQAHSCSLVSFCQCNSKPLYLSD